MDETQIEQVRSFNRAVTRRIGVLSDDYLSRGRPLGESRLLFEIGRHGADLRDLFEGEQSLQQNQQGDNAEADHGAFGNAQVTWRHGGSLWC